MNPPKKDYDVFKKDLGNGAAILCELILTGL